MRIRMYAAGIAAIGALAVSAPAYATEGDDVDVSAWLKANKSTVELFLGVDVDTCKGVDGLTYDQSVRLADAEGIDLKELAKHTDPEAILEYVNDAGITLADIDRFLDRFCAGEVPVPPPTAPDGSTDQPTYDPNAPGGSDADPNAPGNPDGDSTAPDGGSEAPGGADGSTEPAAGDESPTEGSKDGSMADTGSSVALPLGIGAGALGLGAGAFYLARRFGAF